MRFALLGRLADRLILCPSTHAVEVVGKRRHFVPVGSDRVEVWVHDAGPDDRDVDLYVLKFPGTGGRAEFSSDQPANFWPRRRVQLWTVNPPGYGGSSGRASLPKLAPTARAVFDDLLPRAAGRPIMVAANSLGGVSALHLAATRPVAGLILRNPPQLRSVILGRFGWRSMLLGAWCVACQVPCELDCCVNASRASAPAVFVLSARDTIVPARHQRLIHQAYTGPHRVVELLEAEHATTMTDEETTRYHAALCWLWSEAIGGDPSTA